MWSAAALPPLSRLILRLVPWAPLPCAHRECVILRFRRSLPEPKDLNGSELQTLPRAFYGASDAAELTLEQSPFSDRTVTATLQPHQQTLTNPHHKMTRF
jgi:hypothetical protein